MKSNIALLIVEDDYTTRVAVNQALQSLGYEVIYTAKNSQEAIHLVRSKPLDLALLDIGLAQSQWDGISLAKEINRIAPHIKLIFTTAFSDRATLHRSGEVNHENFLIKPVGNEQLSVSIQKALANQEGRTTSVSAPIQCPFSVVHDEVYVKSKHDKYYYRINIRDILYLETNNKGVEFFTTTQTFFTYTALSEVLSRLNHPSIVQVHKRFAVNTLAIKAKSESDLLLTNNTEIPIGRSFRTEKLEALFTRI